MSVNITIEHDGKTYYGTVMRIRSTQLGTEDHGIFTVYLQCEGSGTGVSIGGYGLDAWNEDARERVATAYGMDQIKQIIRTAGCVYWEKLAGTDIIVLHDSPHILGSVAAGFADIRGDRVLIFKDHADSWVNRESADVIA